MAKITVSIFDEKGNQLPIEEPQTYDIEFMIIPIKGDILQINSSLPSKIDQLNSLSRVLTESFPNEKEHTYALEVFERHFWRFQDIVSVSIKVKYKPTII